MKLTGFLVKACEFSACLLSVIPEAISWHMLTGAKVPQKEISHTAPINEQKYTSPIIIIIKCTY